MKIRADFVTNSSSSNFLIVGVADDEDLIRELMEAEGKEEFKPVYGVDEGEVVNFYGSYDWDMPYYAGIPIEKLMETMTLPQIKEFFRKLVLERLGIEIYPEEIELYYGEVGE